MEQGINILTSITYHLASCVLVGLALVRVPPSSIPIATTPNSVCVRMLLVVPALPGKIVRWLLFTMDHPLWTPSLAQQPTLFLPPNCHCLGKLPSNCVVLGILLSFLLQQGLNHQQERQSSNKQPYKILCFCSYYDFLLKPSKKWGTSNQINHGILQGSLSSSAFKPSSVLACPCYLLVLTAYPPKKTRLDLSILFSKL